MSEELPKPNDHAGDSSAQDVLPEQKSIVLRELDKRTIGSLTHAEMHLLIDSLGSDAQKREDMETGLAYLHTVLNERGTSGFLNFVEAGSKKLDIEGKYESYDFVGANKRLLEKAPLNLRNRRNFLRTLGWGIPGVVFGTAFTDKMADQALSAVERYKGTPPEERVQAFKKVYDWMSEYLFPPSETLLSAALVYECVENWKRSKLEQVANGVAEVAKHLGEGHPRSPDLPTR